jgi:hypothetical protein
MQLIMIDNESVVIKIAEFPGDVGECGGLCRGE